VIRDPDYQMMLAQKMARHYCYRDPGLASQVAIALGFEKQRKALKFRNGYNQ